MLYSTKGVAIHHYKYGENSIIAKIYTEEFGIKSYLLKGVRSKKSKSVMSLIQPLQLLDLIVYNNQKKDLQYIKEINGINDSYLIHEDIYKSSIAVFLAECLLKSINESEQNKDLFQFIVSSIEILENTENTLLFQHLFLMKLNQFLGFFIDSSKAENKSYFDLYESEFTNTRPKHDDFIDGTLLPHFIHLNQISYDELTTINIKRNERNILLGKILKYHQLHNSGMGNILSYEILITLFNDIE